MTGDKHLLPTVTTAVKGVAVASGHVTRDASCESSERFEMMFNNPGLPCFKWEEMSSGTLQAVDSEELSTFKLDPLSSSPMHDYYVSRRFEVTGGPRLRGCLCVCVCLRLCMCVRARVRACVREPPL